MDEILKDVLARAEVQHSLINVAQMFECGARHMWIKRRTGDGHLVRLGLGVYGMAGVPMTFKRSAMAAVLATRGPALVSHRSAAHLLGFERVLEPQFVEITVPRHRRPQRRPGLRVHESTAFDLAQPTAVDAIPVTGVARTVLDCAPTEMKPIRLLDDAVRRKVVTWDELWVCLLTHTVRGRDVRAYRDILLERDGNVPPVGEFAPRMAEMLTAAGIPMPVFEHRVVVDGHEYYLDLAWPERMVAVECNDAGSHHMPKAFRRDPMKRNRCERVGWRYLEFTWWDMVHEAPEVVAQVLEAMQRAAA